jgi:hypothetical protein
MSLFPEGVFAVGGMRRRLAFPATAGSHLLLAARVGDLGSGALGAYVGFRVLAYGGGYFLLYVLPEAVSGD